MIREQKWVIVPVDMPEDESTQLAESNGACGFIRGIPMSLQLQAQNESWSLPHVWAETWDDGIN